MFLSRAVALVSSLAGMALLAACTVGPDYLRPAAPVTANFKELKGWKQASPRDGLDHGPWWRVYGDPTLNNLVEQVAINNQTVAASAAAYDQARAIIREAEASFLPTINGSYGVTTTGTGVTTPGVPNPKTTFTAQLPGTWSLDLWGRIRRQVESNISAAQVSAADLADAQLSAQAQLAVAYFNLRAEDSLRAILQEQISNYQKTLDITQKQFNGGIVTKADVATAQTQLYQAQAQEIGLTTQRQQYEHAIAILTGRPPAALSLAPGGLPHTPPAVPVSLPSDLLERRPDIAAAERAVQQQNALIGVATAAYYPDITLSASLVFSGPEAFPFTAADTVWSLGAQAADTIFDGGLRKAQVDAARASYHQSVANYRQTVLTAFGQVEDQLVAIRTGQRQLAVQEQAVASARQAVNVYLDQYRAGTVAFTTVVTAEASLLNDQEQALTTRQNLFVASVNLIEALGGGWDEADLPDQKMLARLTRR